MTVFERIKYLREKQGMSQQDLALKVGYRDKSAISKVERGDREINQSMIVKYAQALGVSPTYLMFGENSSFDVESYGLRPITRKRFPMLGEIACGKPIFANEEHESYIDASSSIDADFCLTAKGDSMINAGIKDGDVVFIKMMEMVNNGDIAAVIIDDEATLKRVYYYPNQQKLLLSPENPKYPPLIYENEQLDTINILGKAVCYMSML